MAWPPTPGDVRKMLNNIDPAIATDPDVQAEIDAAIDRMEKRCGPRRGQTFTTVAHLADPYSQVYLEHRGASVLSVNDVTSGFTFDPDVDEFTVTLAAPAIGTVKIVATAPTTVPAELERAVIDLAKHFWLQDHPGAAGQTDAASPMSYTVPNRIQTVFNSYREIRT